MKGYIYLDLPRCAKFESLPEEVLFLIQKLKSEVHRFPALLRSLSAFSFLAQDTGSVLTEQEGCETGKTHPTHSNNEGSLI